MQVPLKVDPFFCLGFFSDNAGLRPLCTYRPIHKIQITTKFRLRGDNLPIPESMQVLMTGRGAFSSNRNLKPPAASNSSTFKYFLF